MTPSGTRRRPPIPLTAAEVPDRISNAKISHLSYKPPAKTEPVRVSVSAARSVEFEYAAPVRKQLAYQGQFCKPGYYLMASVGDLVAYESRFEMAHLMLLDREGTAAAVASQPFRMHWRDGKNARSHVPDFFVRHTDGTAEVVDVKGSARAETPGNALVFGVTARLCAYAGFGYRVATDIPTVTLNNVRWLSGYRIPPQQAGAIAPHVLAAGAQVTAFEDLLGKAVARSRQHPLLVKATAFHLLWTGALQFDLALPLRSGTAVAADRWAVRDGA